MRATFVKTLEELAQKDKRVFCVLGDTGFSVFEGFEKKFPQQFLNVGIAEQNFVSFGAGLAAMGMRPFIYNVASFMTYRAFEQIELDVCYQENPVVLVGVGGGHAYGTAGPTHHAYFDLALMSGLPNITVICPADPVEMRAAMIYAYQLRKPVYIRIGRSANDVIHAEKILKFTEPSALLMSKGCNEADAVLLATGTMVKDAMQAVALLQKQGIVVRLYSVPFIKPLDTSPLEWALNSCTPIFTLEEHSMRGGLGTAVEEALQQFTMKPVTFKKFGFPDMFAPVTGSRDYLNDLYGLSPVKVAAQITQTLEAP